MNRTFVSTRTPLFSSKNKQKQTQANEDYEDEGLEELTNLLKGPDTMKNKNHLYFYADVTQASCLDVNQKINELNKELLKHCIEYDCPPPNIYLHINSNGGDLLAAFSVVDTIINSRVPIVSIIEGSAASAATIISMVCHKRYITKHSFMLIHQLSSACSGKFQELQDDFENDKKFMALLTSLYKEHTTMTDKKIKSVLLHDIWWSSQECMDNGLVDALWDSSTTSIGVQNLVSGAVFESRKNRVEMKIEEEAVTKRRKVRK
jgi:ATP-dependent Clp protease protease subunit